MLPLLQPLLSKCPNLGVLLRHALTLQTDKLHHMFPLHNANCIVIVFCMHVGLGCIGRCAYHAIPHIQPDDYDCITFVEW